MFLYLFIFFFFIQISIYVMVYDHLLHFGYRDIKVGSDV